MVVMLGKAMPILAFILALMLTACGMGAAQTAVPTTTPLVPTLTAVASALPTSTTLPASQTPAPIATPEATPTQAPTPALESMRIITTTSTSPDGQWQAQSLAAFLPDGADRYYTRLSVIKTGGAPEWAVVDAWMSLGLGYTVPEPFTWSRDGQFLYYTNRPVPDGCAIFGNGSDLHKVDLRNGHTTVVAPVGGVWLSLSPDEQTLAYWGVGGRQLVLRTLSTGTEHEVRVDVPAGSQAGHFVWSPDGSALVLTLAIRPCSGQVSASHWADATSIVRVEVATRKVTTLVDEDNRLLITTGWPATNTVTLKDSVDEEWRMDPATGQVTEP
jgi:hypothetical protein